MKIQQMLLTALICVSQLATAYEPDKTSENIQKKAVITQHNVTLFKKATGDEGSQASFMQIYFMMKPEMNNRVPISISSYKTGEPDGWLDKNSFIEWNTLQMIRLEPQSGRKLVKIYENQECAELFGDDGQDHSGCQVLGEEPNRFTYNTDLQLLIPVFEKGRNSYQGGFIRVYETGSQTKVAPKTQTQTQATTSKQLGYDIVFVVDSTASMGQFFAPTTEVIQTFIKHIKKLVQGGEIQDMPLRIGVLFFRDRIRFNFLCSSYYITKWAQKLTKHIDIAIQKLVSEKEADCSSEGIPEAVLDGLDRVLNEAKWADNHFKGIILIGDAPPHSVNSAKNPNKLTVEQINKQAAEKNIRILTFKLGDDEIAFKELALKTVAANIGRYRSIPQGDISVFKTNLFNAMKEEWKLLEAGNAVITTVQNNQTTNAADIIDDPQFRQKYHIDQYEALIIRSRLPATSSTSQIVPEFVKGWVPQTVQQQLAAGEFIFIDKSRLTILTSILDSIAEAAMVGLQDGGDAFITTVRSVLAAQTKIPPHQLFHSGESLSSTLKKANILPFKTDILTFTSQEIATWKPEDYERINTILKEKIKILREFKGNPTNSHMFGRMAHLYVPKAFFP